MAIGQQLSQGSDDGVCLGQSATDKISFFGTSTTVVQQSAGTAYTKTTTTTTTTTALTVDITALASLVNTLRTSLVNLGLVA